MSDNPFKTIDICYAVLAEFEGAPQIWRHALFDTEQEARDAWAEFRKDVPELDVSLLHVVDIRTRADGTVHTVGGGCAL